MTTIEPPVQQPIVTQNEYTKRLETSKPWIMYFQRIKQLFSNNVDGSGTAGKIPKWSDANTLTDSIVSEASSKISVTTGTDINDFSDDTTMADESQDALVTEYAVVNYLRSKNIQWDNIVPTFNANNQVTQRLYKRVTVTKVTEVLAYDAYRNISTRTFTGELAEIWTYTYTLTNGERIVTDITKT